MLLLGVLLAGATAAFTGLLISDNLSGGPEYTATVLGNSVATVSTLGAFLTGIALTLIFCLGLALARGHRARPRHHFALRRTAPPAREAPVDRDEIVAGPATAERPADEPEEPPEARSGRGTELFGRFRRR